MRLAPLPSSLGALPESELESELASEVLELDPPVVVLLLPPPVVVVAFLDMVELVMLEVMVMLELLLELLAEVVMLMLEVMVADELAVAERDEELAVDDAVDADADSEAVPAMETAQ